MNNALSLSIKKLVYSPPMKYMVLLVFLFLFLFQAITAHADFRQVNENGFGDYTNHYSWSMSTFQNEFDAKHLYVGTYNPTKGGEIWRYDDQTWQRVVVGGGENPSNTGFRKMAIFKSSAENVKAAIFAGTANSENGAEIYRSTDGENWMRVASGGLGYPTNGTVRGMKAFTPTVGPHAGTPFLYVGFHNNVTNRSGQLWRTFDGFNFTKIIEHGFGDPLNNSMHAMVVFNDQLYVATRRVDLPGFQIWRTADGLNFECVVGPGTDNPGGFGSETGNRAAYHLHVFKGQMYVGAADIGGFGVWRTPDGTTYEQVVTNGFYDIGNMYSWRFETFEDQIWLGTFNILNLLLGPGYKGATVWRSDTGNRFSWREMVGRFGEYYGYGFDNPCNWGIRSFTVFKDKLYMGTANNFECDPSNGGTEVWEWTSDSLE